jgi:similar to spore coat protein
MATQKEKALAPHEALELHELLRSEITGYKKLQKTIIMIEDNELKDFMKDSMKFKRENIEQMQRFILTQGKMQ